MARGYNRLPLAAALLAAASSANAGISIPAGDWTLDIGGIVNAYYTSTRATGTSTGLGLANSTGTRTASNITTGLLPNYLIVSGKTRQNDLDVAFTISIQPGASTTAAGGNGTMNQRQAFLTFGDASWGSFKLGKDLGIYASDAILNDMTLLGVGSNAGQAGGNTTLGRIGTGYVYADWKSQVAYTTPNFNGFSATAGVTQAWNATGDNATSARGGASPAFEGKASYAWTGDVAGKVWVSGITQKIDGINAADAVLAGTGYTLSHISGAITAIPASAAVAGTSQTATAVDIGANVNVAGFGLTGYYNQGRGMGTTTQFSNGLDLAGNKRDSDDWYVQATYVLPTATKLGVSYGESNLDGNAGDTFSKKTNEMWVVGAYHPLTKHLNLVAEFSETTGSSDNRATAATPATVAAAAVAAQAAGHVEGRTQTISLGAILFF